MGHEVNTRLPFSAMPYAPLALSEHPVQMKSLSMAPRAHDLASLALTHTEPLLTSEWLLPTP